jgi:hypothetical protein
MSLPAHKQDPHVKLAYPNEIRTLAFPKKEREKNKQMAKIDLKHHSSLPRN